MPSTMADKETPKATAADPAVDIPDLKKQNEERKKSGIPVAGGGGAGGGGNLAMGGNGAASSAAGSAARSAAGSAARSVVGASRAGSGLLSSLNPVSLLTKFGVPAFLAKTATIAATFGLLGAGGIVVGRGLGVGSTGAPGGWSPSSGISSTIKIARDISDKSGLGAAVGTIRGFLGIPASPRPASGGGGDSTGQVVAGDSGAAGVVPAALGELEGVVKEAAGDGEKDKFKRPELSNSAGENFAKNVFSRSESIKFGQSPAFDRSTLIDLQGKKATADPNGLAGAMAKAGLAGGKGGTMVRDLKMGSKSINTGRRGIKSSRALGQLRAMGTLNAAMRTGGTKASEANSAIAAEQFEGNRSAGASAPPDPGAGGVASIPGSGSGGGAGAANTQRPQAPNCGDDALPDYTTDPPGCKAIPKPSGKNKTPWQKQVDMMMLLLLAAQWHILAGAILIQIKGPPAVVCYPLGVISCIVGIVMGVAILALGVSIMQHGGSGSLQGGIGIVAGVVTILEGILTIAGKIGVLEVAVIAAIASIVAIIQLALRG